MKSARNLLASLAFAVAPAAVAAPLQLAVHVAGEAGFYATSTLIKGDKEAVLVDAQFTRSEAHRLAAEILESGKTLTTIFVTHAHPDHHFGLEVLTRQFPAAKVVARPAVIAELKAISPGKLAYWKPLYGDDLTETFVVPEPVTDDALTLEGRRLELVDLAEGESEAATAVYVPELKTLIAGDLAFDGVHLWLAEGRPDAWLKNLAAVKAAKDVQHVVAGHKDPARPESKDLLAEDARYIRTFQKVVRESKTADEALRRLLALYPDYELPVIAEIAVKAGKGS